MGSTLNVDQIAELLRFYEDALSSVRSALTDLELSPSYLMLTDASVTGETTRRYGKAAKESKNLWPLSEAAAIQLEGTRHFFERTKGKGKNRLELIGYLHDPWYEISTLEDRQNRRYSIQQTFAEIAELYTAVLVGVEEIDALWSSLMPRIKAAQQTMAELERQTKQLGVVEPLVGRTKSLALDLADRLTSDPLSVTIADGPALDLKVSEAARQVASLQTGHDNLHDDIVQAAELVAVVRVLRERAEAAWKETTEKIFGAADLVRVPSDQVVDGPQGIALRLETATNPELGGDWSQRRTVLDLWLATARRLRDQLERAESTNRAPLNYRDELRGRLRAYQAKAAGIGEAENLELSERFEQARLVLYTSPTDLDKAEELLTHLAARLKK